MKHEAADDEERGRLAEEVHVVEHQDGRRAPRPDRLQQAGQERRLEGRRLATRATSAGPDRAVRHDRGLSRCTGAGRPGRCRRRPARRTPRREAGRPTGAGASSCHSPPARRSTRPRARRRSRGGSVSLELRHERRRRPLQGELPAGEGAGAPRRVAARSTPPGRSSSCAPSIRAGGVDPSCDAVAGGGERGDPSPPHR